ncbi:MAG: hypothetical protein HY973_03730, partial [Candidatus Kerfeldbacteria bacterium]|nr:hypothetical protein [Candidatus Kerfeldbacteria bacterium]
EGLEIIDYDLSDAAKTELYRGIGILQDNETSVDFFEKFKNKLTTGADNRLSADNYYADLITNLEGISLAIKKQKTIRGETENWIGLKLNTKLVDELLGKE